MKFPDEKLIFGYWLLIMVFVASAAVFFLLGKSTAKVKRKLFRWYVAIGGVLMLGWFYMLGGPMSLLVFIPIYAITAFISLRNTRFCGSCGKALMNQFIRAKFCPRCGADLDAEETAARDTLKY
jgi:predicted RNA-binding Zn-ribbon protein involved in translation (DUF1610 family)